MKLETFRSPTTEIFVEGTDVTATANPWANCEGLSFMLHGKDAAIKVAGSLRWEELDVLLIALTAARGA
jgi:hypothetical protein